MSTPNVKLSHASPTPFAADFDRHDIPVPISTIKSCRAVLASTPLARWEIAEQRTALVDALDYILAKQENP